METLDPNSVCASSGLELSKGFLELLHTSSKALVMRPVKPWAKRAIRQGLQQQPHGGPESRDKARPPGATRKIKANRPISLARAFECFENGSYRQASLGCHASPLVVLANHEEPPESPVSLDKISPLQESLRKAFYRPFMHLLQLLQSPLNSPLQRHSKAFSFA